MTWKLFHLGILISLLLGLVWRFGRRQAKIKFDEGWKDLEDGWHGVWMEPVATWIFSDGAGGQSTVANGLLYR